MPTAWINKPQTKVTLRSQSLVVSPVGETEPGDGGEQRIPLCEVERIVVGDQVALTMPALAALLRADVSVHFIDGLGRPLGSVIPTVSADSAWRMRQYERTRDAVFRLEMARRLVGAKIYNQLRLMQRLAANREHVELGAVATRLRGLMKEAENAGDPDTLRGCEGAASALYFAAWAAFLPGEFPFERRSTRPPGNAVNACLSFLSAVIYNEMVAVLHARGLDPGLGVLHATENGRWSLALDLIEPFRPCVAEALTLRMFAHRMFHADDFESRDGGVFLGKEGRGKVIRQYEQRMERPFASEHAGHRTTMRQQFAVHASTFKSALEDIKRFSPFRMN